MQTDDNKDNSNPRMGIQFHNWLAASFINGPSCVEIVYMLKSFTY